MPFHLVPLKAHVNWHGTARTFRLSAVFRYILILKLKKLHQKVQEAYREFSLIFRIG